MTLVSANAAQSKSTTAPASRAAPIAPAPGIRLLRGSDCWWVVRDGTFARLPTHAATEGLYGVALVPEAYTALDDQQFFAESPDSTYAVTVLTATACNLGCAYCFQNTAPPEEGSYAPPRIATAILNSKRVEQVAAFVQRQLNRLGLRDCSLLLFGGEPLLNPIGATAMLRAMQPFGLIEAEIITNGVLLTQSLAVKLTDAGLRRVQITFDGTRETHDRIRVTRNGRATYDHILRNVTAAAESTNLSWHFRINISHRNFDGLERLIDDLGKAVPPGRTSLHLALIDDTGLGYDNTISYTSECADRFIALNNRAISHGMTIPMSKPLSACPYCSVFGGDRGVVINADGTLYSSWETVGREDWIVGDITNGYLPHEIIRPRWVTCNYDSKAHGTNEQTRQFFDRIDAAALDSMYPQPVALTER